MRVVITGGAGFLGSHLADALITRGDKVTVVDDLSTGRLENVRHLRWKRKDDDFSFVSCDVSSDRLLLLGVKPDVVVHMASPASPPAYQRFPVHTLRTGSRGTENAIRLAAQNHARFVLASTSEVYGEPLVHPQREDYFGNVNPIGPRSMYDEAKRFAEAMTAAHVRSHGLNAGIVRIFNTYGPRMRADDGRVVTNFITQALSGLPLTVYGGAQTRSFCYVDDLIDGVIRMIDSRAYGPINLGNPIEIEIRELAAMISRLTGVKLRMDTSAKPTDDPSRRRPDVSRAREVLGWGPPPTSLSDGLIRTIRWFRSSPDEVEAAVGFNYSNAQILSK